MFLESTVGNVQRMAFLDRLATLLYSGGDTFGKRVRRHNQNHNN